MKRIFSAAAILATLASSAFATDGNERGNGGDGVVLASGQVVLFDLFERNLDADKLIDPLAQKPAHRGLTDELFGIRSMLDNRTGPGIDTRSALAAILGRLGASHPQLVVAVLKELEELHWTEVSLSLLPNPDTRPFVDLTGVKRIGCARNIDGAILYSKQCSGDSMSTANKAALILHEALYSMYRRAKPDANDSFPVRTLVSLIIQGDDSEIRATLPKQLAKMGLKTLADSEEATRQVFFGGNHWYSSSFQCTFQDESLKRVEFISSSGVDFHGTIVWGKGAAKVTHTFESLFQDDPNDDGSEQSPIWEMGVPRFDPAKRTASLYMSREYGDGESLSFEIDFRTGKAVARHAGGGWYPIDGKCGKLE